jgi:hypothetical protein
MNYYAVLKKHYDGKIWGIAEDYSTLDWGDETAKPSDEEMIHHRNAMEHEYLENIMRQQRNQLLKDCDYRYTVIYLRTGQQIHHSPNHQLNINSTYFLY